MLPPESSCYKVPNPGNYHGNAMNAQDKAPPQRQGLYLGPHKYQVMQSVRLPFFWYALTGFADSANRVPTN